MPSLTTVSFEIGTTDISAGLGLEVWIDNQQLYDKVIDFDTESVSFEIQEDPAEHELRMVMKNKQEEHTTIDADGNIVRDARLLIKNITIDGIKLGHLVTEQAIYTHDFNGTAPELKDQFYQELGCNGQVSLKFTTPVYIWLLEHM